MVNGVPLLSTLNADIWSTNTNGIHFNTGNVGIGGISPQHSLDVEGGLVPLRVKGDVKFDFYNNPANNIKFHCDGANGYIDLNSNYVPTSGGADARLFINSNSNKQVVIGGTGGLIVQGETHVENTIHGKRVRVCGNGWCDYVFEKDFKLTPILDVESFINMNKHLPNVPSASEVENNEVDLFEMQKIQMQKIEEMMLYIIELKKENNELKKLIAK